MKARLTIERVVLDGVSLPSRDIPALREAIHAELLSLLSNGTRGEIRSAGATPRLTGTDVRIDSAGPSLLGKQIARSIHASIRRER